MQETSVRICIIDLKVALLFSSVAGEALSLGSTMGINISESDIDDVGTQAFNLLQGRRQNRQVKSQPGTGVGAAGRFFFPK